LISVWVADIVFRGSGGISRYLVVFQVIIPRARLLSESFLLGVITIPRAYGLPGVKLLEASTFLEAFLPGNLLLLGACGFLESTHLSQNKRKD
jgi:hypothetical protein